MSGLYTELVEYIESLTITQGRYSGQKMQLHSWEKAFLRGFCSTTGDCGISLARGGGKSTFTAALACAALVGPLAVPRSQVLLVASSLDQGRVLSDHVQAFLADQMQDKTIWRIEDNSQRIRFTHKPTGIQLRVLGCDPRRMHGLAPRLLVGDELAQWESTKIDRALAALETSMGKIEDSRAIWIGTRADEPEHPFEKLLHGGCEFSKVYSARPDDPPFQRRSWKRANPGLDHLPDLEARIRTEAERAKKDPSALASFKALRLNQGVSDVVENVLLAAETWRRIEADDGAPRGQRYVLGLDLGQSASMSAAAAYWLDTGGLDCFAVFPEMPHLLDRGRSDGVNRLYVECYTRGELIQAGLRVSDIGELMDETLTRWGEPMAIVCDRWREAELRQVMELLEYPRVPVVIRGMGFQDGGADVREFRRACLDDHVVPAKSLLLRSAMSGARVVTDPAGNSKLSKGGQGRKVRARDDAVAASILAVAEGRRIAKREAKAQPFWYSVLN